jgi:hypothetical protein
MPASIHDETAPSSIAITEGDSSPSDATRRASLRAVTESSGYERDQQAQELASLTAGKPKAYFTLSNISKVILSGFGLSASAFYWEPSLTCSQSEDCGKWLSDATSPEFAHGVFLVSGGSGFGIGNAYFATYSLEALVAYINKQKSPQAKVALMIVVLGLTTTQTLPLLFACIGTNAPLWASIITVAGGVPAALYGVVGMLENEFPRAKAKAQWLLKKYYLKISACGGELLSEQRLQQNIMIHYEKHLADIIHQADANWHYVLQHIDTITLDHTKTPLQNLFSINADYKPQTYLDWGTQKVGHGVGLGLAFTFSYSFAANTFIVLNGMIDSDAACFALAMFFSLSQVYGNIKLTTAETIGIAKNIKNILTGEPIDSVSLNTRRTLTIAIRLALLIPSALSYSSGNVVTTNSYRGPNINVFRILASIGIDLYHDSGVWKLFQLLLGQLTPNAREKLLFDMNIEKNELHKLTPVELRREVESNSEIAAIIGAKSFEKNQMIKTKKNYMGIDNEYSSDTEADEYEEIDDGPRHSVCTSICNNFYSLFYPKVVIDSNKEQYQVTDRHVSLNPPRKSTPRGDI